MKAKYIKTVVSICTVALCAVSCSIDYVPVAAPSEVTEGTQTDSTVAVLKDKKAADEQLRNLYELFRNRQEHMHVDLLLVGDAHADNAYGGTTGAEVQPFENNSVDGSNPVLERDWNRYLEDVAKANVLIVGSEQLYKAGSISESEYHLYKAQGEIFRAMQMFALARLWGSFPLITTVAKTITSENIDEVYPTYFPPRSTPKECWQQIEKDLLDAEKYAPDFDSKDRTLMTKTVAQAMLAKVYAEKELQDYGKVIEYAEKVRATSGLTLEPKFETLWGFNDATKDCEKRNTSESILEVQWRAGSSNWESWMYGRPLENPDFYFTWAKWITPSRDLINAFEKAGDTERFNQTVVYYECTWSNYYPKDHYPFMYKLRSGFNNEYRLRLADIILLEAEAYAHQGNAQKVAELVNITRNRAKLPNLTADKTSSKDAMINTVLDERRLELALEGERWFDLCRNNKVEEVMNAVYGKDSGRLKQERQFSQFSYLMPIPQTALDQNNNLEQNPGY